MQSSILILKAGMRFPTGKLLRLSSQYRQLTTATTVAKAAAADVAPHFIKSSTPHALGLPKKEAAQFYASTLGSHTGRQQNHIWTDEELSEKLSKLYHHKYVIDR